MNPIERLAALPVLSKARTWFSGRSEREQILLASLAGVAVVGLWAVFLWGPLQASRAAGMAEIARYDELLARAQSMDRAMLARAPIATDTTERPSVAGSAASHGLLVRRIEPDGDATRISLEDAEFARILDWIAEMEATGLARVASVRMERRPEPGTVNAQVTLED